MGILIKLERLAGLKRKRKSKPRRKTASKKRMPKGLREYWAKKRKKR